MMAAVELLTYRARQHQCLASMCWIFDSSKLNRRSDSLDIGVYDFVYSALAAFKSSRSRGHVTAWPVSVRIFLVLVQDPISWEPCSQRSQYTTRFMVRVETIVPEARLYRSLYIKTAEGRSHDSRGSQTIAYHSRSFSLRMRIESRG
jgi:hypothetical protein